MGCVSPRVEATEVGLHCRFGPWTCLYVACAISVVDLANAFDGCVSVLWLGVSLLL